MNSKELRIRRNLHIGILVCLCGIAICLTLLIIDMNKVDTIEESEPVYYYTVTAEERELIARIVHCEASEGSQEQRIAVASVVFNRLDAGYWGDTIEEVIYYDCGFTPVLFDKLYKWELDERDYEAVDYVLLNGPSVPTYVRYFRDYYDHEWEGYANYCIIGTMYFGYFIDWEKGEW
jgi:hypothetical protein